MKKLLFIFNPHSGKAQIKTQLLNIIDIFVKGGYEVTVRPTQAQFDAYETVISRGADFDAIVCSGGDGTLNETIKGLMRLDRKIPLGYIPSGTMNDFASSLGISKDMSEAANKIIKGVCADVDVGSFNDEYFTYIAGFGTFTDVSYETPQNMKNMFGHLAYIMEGMRKIYSNKSLQSYHVTIKYDDIVIEDDFIFGMISNSTSVGGLKGLSGTDVLLNDGVFEGFLIKSPKNLIELQFTINSLLKRELDAKCFYFFKSSKVEFHTDHDLPWTLDGEFGGNCRNVCIKNNCQAVQIFADTSDILIETDNTDNDVNINSIRIDED